MKKILFFLFVFALPVMIAGCGSGESIGQKAGEKIMEKTIEAQTGGQVDIDTSSDGVTIKSEDGQSQISGGANAKLPDNFPKELVAAPDAKLFMSSSSEAGSSVAFTTDSEQADLYEKYKSGLANDGWKKVMEIDTGNAKMVTLSKGATQASITIGENSTKDKEGKSLVNISLIEEKAVE